ncbi:MAG TPA: SUMF1/EgtB/PvdO family nonheme iron enzyme [Candidatus Acidoferrales bacterium]|jgi:iron(II)-dependent oxidoreductase|nr:SUMF1/EgtB/PvdO family nonheme iron enzyme [Candidatus Acidoferrales bacterium]
MRTTTDLTRALCQARQQTDELFRLVRPDALYERPIVERHRILFYIGHLEAFDWNLIGRYALDVASFHPTFDRLFAFGIDPPPGQLPSDQPSDWPGLGEMERYNRRTRDKIDALLGGVPEQLLHVAIEHRLMHAETFAYILHQLDYEKKVAQPSWPVEAVRPAQEMLEIPAGTAQLGMNNGGFGWDNEFQAHHVEVPAFSIGKYKVTNGEYLEYVRQGADAPFFWRKSGGAWHYRGMWTELPLPLEWPVYVTWREAEAYAKWRGMRLPSEAEWHRAAARSPVSCNVDFRYWDPTPVTADDAATQPARAGGEISQMTGNGWEWTSSEFAPFPGFEPFPFYANYSAPFFDGRHFVLKGASPRTAASFLRPSFRNWFRPSYPYLYAAVRLVES